MPVNVANVRRLQLPLMAPAPQIDRCPQCGGNKTKAAIRCFTCAHPVVITERDLKIFSARESEGRTLNNIAAEYGMSRQAIQVICLKTYRRLIWFQARLGI